MQVETASAYRKIGDVQGNGMKANLGDSAGALVSYRKGLQLAESALKRDPSRDDAAAEAGWLNLKIGELLLLANDAGQAQAHMARGLDLMRARIQRPGGSPSKMTDYASALLETYLATRGNDPKAARSYLEQAATIYETVLQRTPDDRVIQRNVALAHRYLATYEKGETALKHLSRSLDLDQRRVAFDPWDSFARLDVAMDLAEIGYRQWDAGDAKTALPYYRRSLTIRQELASADPKNVLAKKRLGLGHLFVARALLDTNATREGSEHAGKAVEILAELCTANASDREAQSFLVEAASRLGQAESRLGRSSSACVAFRRGSTALATFGADSPHWLNVHRDVIARGLASCQK